MAIRKYIILEKIMARGLHNHEQKRKRTARKTIMFRCVSDAADRLVHFGASQIGNNIYIEKRLGLKVLGAADYINKLAADRPGATRVIFGKAPAIGTK
jgi:hypothetical protein